MKWKWKEKSNMKAIITGMNGTVAPYVYEELLNHDFEVIIWDRSQVDIHSFESVHNFISLHQPDIFFHLATGPIEWLEAIVKSTDELNIRLLFTSTVSVFSEKGSGPYDITSIPNSEEDYGRYKIMCEQLITNHHHNAVIVRLGWQIGAHARSNNMFHYVSYQHKTQGYIEASSKWVPSCSFLDESARVLVDCALHFHPGLYMANSNRKYSFFEIVSFLKDKYHTDWNIKETTSFQRDDRMIDSRVKMKELF